MYQKRNRELEIIALFSGNYKARFYLRQIAKLTGLPLKTCQNALLQLEKSKILMGKSEGKNKYFSLNLNNIQAKSFLLKSEINKTDIFLEHYFTIKTFLKEINTNIPIIIFGSFAKFKADKNSDLDFLIIAEKEEKLPFHLLPYKIHQIYLAESSFVKAIKERETIIKELEENHAILNNHSFYVNIMWQYHGK